MTVVAVDLGVCGAFLPDGSRCDGHLIVDREVGSLIEATCDQCGDVAARPASRGMPESEEREVPWWQR